MRAIYIFCAMLLLSLGASAQRKKDDCRLTTTTDSFTGKKKIATKGNRIIEKLYLAEAMLNSKNREGWHITLVFLHSETGGLQLCLKHETTGVTSSVSRMDFRFADGTVLTLDKPVRGEYVMGSVLVFPHQPTYFALTKEQLDKFAKELLVKSRVKFEEFPGDPEVEKDLNKLKAEKVRAEAACLRDELK